MAQLTRSLGAFIAGIRFEALPGQAIDTARLGFTDCIATLIIEAISAAGTPCPETSAT